VAELAELASASPYEILTGLNARLPRRYLGGETAPVWQSPADGGLESAIL